MCESSNRDAWGPLAPQRPGGAHMPFAAQAVPTDNMPFWTSSRFTFPLDWNHYMHGRRP